MSPISAAARNLKEKKKLSPLHIILQPSQRRFLFSISFLFRCDALPGR